MSPLFRQLFFFSPPSGQHRRRLEMNRTKCSRPFIPKCQSRDWASLRSFGARPYEDKRPTAPCLSIPIRRRTDIENGNPHCHCCRRERERDCRPHWNSQSRPKNFHPSPPLHLRRLGCISGERVTFPVFNNYNLQTLGEEFATRLRGVNTQRR